jgi:hypothetical protein
MDFENIIKALNVNTPNVSIKDLYTRQQPINFTNEALNQLYGTRTGSMSDKLKANKVLETVSKAKLPGWVSAGTGVAGKLLGGTDILAGLANIVDKDASMKDRLLGVGQLGLGLTGFTPAGMVRNAGARALLHLGGPIAGSLMSGLYDKQQTTSTNTPVVDTVQEQTQPQQIKSRAFSTTSNVQQPTYSTPTKSIEQIISENTGGYTQPTSEAQVVPSVANTYQIQPQVQSQSTNNIADLLLNKYDQMLREIQGSQSKALQTYKRKLPLANISDTLIKAGLAGYARAYDNPKLADAYNGNEYSKRLEKNLEVDTAEANKLADRLNKMNELGGALAVAENIGVAPEVALANKDLLKILVDAEKNKLNYNRYIYKANIDLEIANRRNELMKYGYDANNATKLAVADVMARANMYGADTRLLGNYGMFGANVPQEVINYMTYGTLPTQGGIQNIQQQPTQIQPITLKEASQRIGRTY